MKINMCLLLRVVVIFVVNCVFCSVDLADVTHEVTQCENTDLHLSCKQNTTILIDTVQFGPLSYEDDIYVQYDEENDQIRNKSNIESLCNGNQTCLLPKSEHDHFRFYQQLPRKVFISYLCDQFEYSYVGCYEDNAIRLFTGRNITGTRNMSSLICRHYCFTEDNRFPYFGTENQDECFCGYENEKNKLGQQLYRRKHKDECFSSCMGQIGDERCGRHGRMSVYKNENGTRESRELKSEDIYYTASMSCLSSGKLTKVELSQYQISKRCEKENIYQCSYNDDICWLRSSVPIYQVRDMHLQNELVKFVKINYSCRAIQKDGSLQSPLTNEQNNAGTIGIAVGLTCGICIIGVIMVGICKVKRNRFPNKGRNVSDNRTQRVSFIEGNENVNSSEEHVYSNENGSQNGIKYSVVFKPGRTTKSLESEGEHKVSFLEDDVYAETIEGVYDVSNRQIYKNKADKGDTIYSHSTEGVYDITTGSDRNQPETENLYDHGFHQTKGNEYDIAST